MKLYHFTSPYHLPAILDADRLTVTESNISNTREHKGPDVVWLTDDPEPSHHTKRFSSRSRTLRRPSWRTMCMLVLTGREVGGRPCVSG
jgi:hypothetical protein